MFRLNRSTVRERWKALTLLSIIVPVGLLATFRLTGIIREPEEPIAISETTTLENVAWKFERPYSTVSINERVQNLYTSGEVSVDVSIYVVNTWRG